MKLLVRIEIPDDDAPQFNAIREQTEAHLKKKVSYDAMINGVVIAWIRMSRDYLTPSIPQKDLL